MVYARVITFRVEPTMVDTVVRWFQADSVPLIQQQPGFHSITLLVDHTSGACQSISLWNELAQRDVTGASSSYLQRQLAPIMEFLLTTPVVENYHVAVQEAAAGQHDE